MRRYSLLWGVDDLEIPALLSSIGYRSPFETLPTPRIMEKTELLERT